MEDLEDTEPYFYDFPGFSAMDITLMGVLAVCACVVIPFVWVFSKITGKEMF